MVGVQAVMRHQAGCAIGPSRTGVDAIKPTLITG
jgi:hypothetical protein